MALEQSRMMNQPADQIIIDPGQCLALDHATTGAPYILTGRFGATSGKCHVHVNEFQSCEGDAYNLDTEVTIWDVGGKQIGYQSSKEAGATDPLSVVSKLETPLVVIPEHQHDYIQFNLGTESCDSRQQDQTVLSWCSTGGWDPKSGPTCGRIFHAFGRSL